MKLLFKLSGILRILFIINIFLIDQYEEHLFRNTNTHLFDNLHLDLDIHFPWYFTLVGLVLVIGYFLNLAVINLLAFKPRWKVSQYFYRRIPAIIIYSVELILLVGTCIIGYNKFNDAYAHRDYGIWGEILKPLVDPVEANNLHLIDKLNALNFIIPALATLIVVATFWKMRAIDQSSNSIS